MEDGDREEAYYRNRRDLTLLLGTFERNIKGLCENC